MSCKVAKLLSYEKLMAFVKSIDKGWVGNVKEDFCYDLNEDEKVNGCYRSLTQYLPFLASFYLKVAQENLSWFNNEINTFHVALGGDGAPFGKDDTACSWLVSFLNRGKHILSNSENFLIFGANCSENCLLFSDMLNFFFARCQKLRRKHSRLMEQRSGLFFPNFQMTLKCLLF